MGNQNVFLTKEVTSSFEREIKEIASYYQIIDIKTLEKHKYIRFKELLATNKIRQKFYRTALT